MVHQRRYVIPVLILLPSFLLSAVQSDAGTTGMAFLRMGVGARAAALGDAYVAVPGDGFANYWNPAGLAFLQGREFMATHNEWAQGIRYEYGGFALGSEGQGLGLSAAFIRSGNLERRVGPSAEPLGTFAVYDLALSACYARRVTRDIALGVAGRWLAEKIHVEGASGVAFDLGVLYAAPVEGLHVGLSLRNLGGMNELKKESIDLPTDLWVGLSHRCEIPASDTGVLVSSDLQIPENGSRRVQVGVEVHPVPPLYLRAGYGMGGEVRALSAGFGLTWDAWTIDYAFVPLKQDLGRTHQISLRWSVCSGDGT